MSISIIVACGRNNVIGSNNLLPWHLPADLAYFKRRTLGKPIVMGRKTWDNLQLRPLPGRFNIVMSRNPGFSSPDAAVVHSFAELKTVIRDDEECMVIGGAEIYHCFLPHADCIYLTQVMAEFEGDAYFPELDPGRWQESKAGFHPADEKNPHSMEFLMLTRVSP